MRKNWSSYLTLILVLAAMPLCGGLAFAQQGLSIFGDVRVTTDNDAVLPKEVLLILRRVPDGEIARQWVSSRGRYRFNNLKEGEYEILAEADGKEVGRLSQIRIGGMTLSNSPYGYQNDLEFRLRAGNSSSVSAGVISAADVYDRPASTKAIFTKAEEAVAKKKLDQAATLLKQVVETDNADFQAWTALGSIYFAQEKLADAEQAYQHAIAVKPGSPRAQFNLGRVLSSQKNVTRRSTPSRRRSSCSPPWATRTTCLVSVTCNSKKVRKRFPI